MRKSIILFIALLASGVCLAQSDTVRMQGSIGEVIVEGSRHHSDLRHTPLTVSIIPHTKIESQHSSSLLPTIAQQVPGLFVTSRGVMGYGVSTGAAGTMSLRGIGGRPTTGLVLTIDGVPIYRNIWVLWVTP